MNKKKISVKDITIAALLTALALLIPHFIPSITIEPIFTMTLTAHMPAIISMFVGPFAVIGTAVGSALGFFLKLGPWVSLRAFSHIIFCFCGYKMISKKWNVFLIIVLTGLIHAAAEIIVGFISILSVGIPSGGIFNGIILTIGAGTFIHHCIDFAISMVVLYALKSAYVLNIDFNFKSLKG